MAGDGLVTSAETVFGTGCIKVHKLDDGRLVGVAGSLFDAEAFLCWLKHGGEAPSLSDNFDALMVDTDGKCFNYDHRCRCIPEELPTACGSGRQIAIGALEAGASPEQAVAIAAKRNTGTGGKITVVSL